MKQNNFLSIKMFAIVAAAIVVSYSLPVHAFTKTDIVFPVHELGDCHNETECRTFCDNRDSVDTVQACVAFAKKYSLLPADDIAKAEKFAEVAATGGPGGCKNEKDCVSYCETITHITTCVAFAEKYNLMSREQLAEAKNIAAAVKAGVAPPGGCSSKLDCMSYCNVGAHIDECLVFAEKAKLFSASELAQAKKIAPFIKFGQTPGGCASKEDCETYCGDEAHVEQCVTFGEKAGIVSAQEADMVRKFHGKSPGDCAKHAKSPLDARTSCMTFCNRPENQPLCYKFAVDAGILTAEEGTQVGSLSDFQACIPLAGKEIQFCFETNLGPELFDSLKKGVLPLEGDLAGMMAKIRESRKCVNRYLDTSFATFTDNPDALSCIDAQGGKDYVEKIKRGEVKCGDAAQSQKKIESCMETALSTQMNKCFSLACSEAADCIQKSQKPIKGNKQGAGTNPELKAKIETKMNACVQEEIDTCVGISSCSGFFSCIENLKTQSNGQEEKQQSNPALEVKIAACTKEMESGQRNKKEEQQPQPPTPQSSPRAGQPYKPEIDCSAFVSIPSCTYAGPVGSENYKYCKQCLPDK